MTNASSTTNNRTQPFTARRALAGSATFFGLAALLGGCEAKQSGSTSTTSEATAVRQIPSGTRQLTQEWDKTFPKSDKVDHQKVTFRNRYGITLAADLYLPKNRAARAAAGAGRQRSVRRGEGAGVRPVCADHGRARLRHAGVRSVLHRGERWRAAQCRLAGHQHRGLQRGGRLPRIARVRRP